jgi:hypothetical protein
MKVSYYIFYFYPYIPFKWQITKKKIQNQGMENLNLLENAFTLFWHNGRPWTFCI